MSITVLGDGAFGTALAQVLARNGHRVSVWCYSSEAATSIEQRSCNDLYLPAVPLEKTIQPITSLYEAMHGQEGTSPPSWIVEAIPIAHLRSVLEQVRQYYPPGIPWVLATKGIEPETYLLPSEVLSQTLIQEVPTLILSGPSFARELATGVPTGVTLASSHKNLTAQAKELFESETLTIDTTDDSIGTQLCGALKNVIALALGILEGAGYGSNTQALVFTRAVAELRMYLESRNCDTNTLFLLAGIGDLTLTAYSSQSRNRSLGKAIGMGEYRSKSTPSTEGLNTLKSVPSLMNGQYKLFNALYRIVFEQAAVELLIQSSKKNEPL